MKELPLELTLIHYCFSLELGVMGTQQLWKDVEGVTVMGMAIHLLVFVTLPVELVSVKTTLKVKIVIGVKKDTMEIPSKSFSSIFSFSSSTTNLKF